MGEGAGVGFVRPIIVSLRFEENIFSLIQYEAIKDLLLLLSKGTEVSFSPGRF
jgi:hypothetical protein